MRAAAALILHVLSVHYLFFLFAIGLPSLILAYWVRDKKIVKLYFLRRALVSVFVLSLAGGFIFPNLNSWFLNNYGLRGDAIIISSFQGASWFNKSPEVRLMLKIEPDAGSPFVEVVTTKPPTQIVSRLQAGNKVHVRYSPQYRHDIDIAVWQ